MLWYKINSDHEFLLYKFHMLIIQYEINKCHRFKINNHNFPWAFILVTQIYNSQWIWYMFAMSFGKMNNVT